MKNNKDKLTISVDKEIKNKYKQFCEKNGLKVGKQIEIFMENELKDKSERPRKIVRKKEEKK